MATSSYGNKFYLIESPLKHSIAKQKIEVRKTSKNGFTAYFAGRHLAISEVVEPSKLSKEDIEVQKKLDVLALAEKLGNVADSGISRDTICRHRKLIQEGGIDLLKRQVDPDLIHQNRADENVEKVVVDFSLEHPHLGQQKVALQLNANFGLDISPGGVRGIWLHQNINTTALRVETSLLKTA